MYPFRYCNRLGRAALVLFLAGATSWAISNEALAQSSTPTGHDRSAGLEAEGHPGYVWSSTTFRGGPIEGDWLESFADITTLPGDGWVVVNMSEPPGGASWFQGNPAAFTAHSGADNEYIAVNFQSTSGVGTISNWLLTPEIVLQNGTELSFWTRTSVDSDWADRLQVRLSTAGGSTDVGSGAFDFGDFEELFIDINEDLELGVYPEEWTEFTIELSGFAEPASGRFAFRYFVTNAGPDGVNSNYIGIDDVGVDQPKVSTDGDAHALAFSLSQNHPNPVVNATSIQYALGESVPVRIEVFDVMGRRIATLVDAEMSAGMHTAIWNADGVASGVYLYRIQAGSFTQTLRAVVAR